MLLKVTNLSLKYHNRYVFKNLSFSLNRHDFLCIVGPNGSGKSTLLRCLLGELKPSSGKIEFKNDSQHPLIGYLPQNSNLDPNFPASVYEIVSTGALNRTGIFTKIPKNDINSALKTLQIEKLANRKFSQLSGGQRQKVLLARALVASEDLLLLDEPSNNLDYSSKHAFYRTLNELNKHLTIIMVTHDLDHHNLFGNKVLSLDPDRPFFGPTDAYVRRVHAD